MRRRLFPLFVAIVGFSVGFAVARRSAPAPSGTGRAVERSAIVFAPTPDGGRVRHALVVKRAVVPGLPPLEYEPVAIGENGGLVLEPGDWVVTVDGRTYVLAPR